MVHPSASSGLPEDWQVQVLRAYAMFGSIDLDGGATEFRIGGFPNLSRADRQQIAKGFIRDPRTGRWVDKPKVRARLDLPKTKIDYTKKKTAPPGPAKIDYVKKPAAPAAPAELAKIDYTKKKTAPPEPAKIDYVKKPAEPKKIDYTKKKTAPPPPEPEKQEAPPVEPEKQETPPPETGGAPARGAGFDELPYDVNTWNPDDEAHQEKYKQHIDTAYQNYLDAVSKKEGVEPLTQEQFAEHAANRLRELYAGPTQLRAPNTVLAKLIMGNAVKTQFETGTSGGVMDRERRIKREAEFGINEDLDDTLRPVYSIAYSDPGKRDRTNAYGALRLHVDESVDARTTVTGEDTLGSDSTFMQPKTGLNDAPREQVLMSAGANTLQQIGQLSHTANPKAAPSAYREAQIHGGLPLTDVKEIEIQKGNVLTSDINDLAAAEGMDAAVMEVLKGKFGFTAEDLAAVPNLDALIAAAIKGSPDNLQGAINQIVNDIIFSTGNKKTKFVIK